MKIFKRTKRLWHLSIITLIGIIAEATIKRKQNFDVLIVKIDAIGDFVLWLDAFTAFAKKYEGKRVALMCNSHVLEIVRGLEGVDTIFTVKKHLKLDSLYSWAWILKKYHFKEVVNPVYSRTYSMDRLIHLVDADSKVGISGDLSNMSAQDKALCDTFYTRLVSLPSHSDFELFRNAEFVKQVCDPTFTPSLPQLKLSELQYSSSIQGPYCIFSLGAGTAKRAWSVANFIKLAETLPKHICIVLVGAGKYERMASAIFEKSVAHHTHNMVGKTSLVELGYLIKNAAFLIGNDSAHVHMSAALRTPSICIAGGGHWGRFIPYSAEISEKKYHPRVVNHFMDCYGCSWQCIYPLVQSNWRCVAEVEAENVSAEVRSLILELGL